MFLALVVFAFILTVSYYVLRYFRELIPLENLHDKAIFITGCDSGFGKEIAIKCAKNGFITFAGCLSKEGIENLIAETHELPGKVYPLHLDVSNDESIKAASEFVAKNMGSKHKLWAIVNNAGAVCSLGPDEWISIDQYMETFNINTLGMVRCVHAFLPLLKESKGRILATSSVLGRITFPYRGDYNMSKFAVEAYIDTIRSELKPFGITCHIFEPGAFYTSIASNTKHWVELIERCWNNLNSQQQYEYGTKYKESLLESQVNGKAKSSRRLDYVVNDYYHAITAKYPRLRYRCGWDAIFYYIPLSLFPTEIQDWIKSNMIGSLIKTLPAVLEKEHDN